MMLLSVQMPLGKKDDTATPRSSAEEILENGAETYFR